jgi:hypothetical protein
MTRENEYSHRGYGHVDVLFAMPHVRRQACRQVDDRKSAAGLVGLRQNRSLPNLELGDHGPILVCLYAQGAECKQFPSIRETCDHNCFDAAEQLGVQARRLVRDQGVTSLLEIELRERVVGQIVCLVYYDAVGNSVARSDFANSGQKRPNVTPLFNMLHLR